MLKHTLKTLDKKKLRRWLLLFFVALLVPTAVLIQQSYSRLKWEAFHQHQQMAQELSVRIDSRFAELIRKEDQRPFTDYAFLNVAGDATAGFLQRSPLSGFPVAAELPGLMGYFQVDNAGQLVTPLVPDSDASQYGISEQELEQRLGLQNQIRDILATNQLLQKSSTLTAAVQADDSGQSVESGGLTSPPQTKSSMRSMLADSVEETSEVAEPQIAFDQLKSLSKLAPQASDLGRLEDLNIQQNYQQAAPVPQAKSKVAFPAQQQQSAKANIQVRQSLPVPEKRARIELNSLPEAATLPSLSAPQSPRILTFESEIDPLEFSQLASGHFVLYRKVWLNGQKYVQGLLIEPEAFLSAVINTEFRATALSQMSDVLVAYQGNVLTAFSGRSSYGYLSSSAELTGEQLYKTRLSAPLSDIQLLYSVTQLPAGPGGQVILWLAVILGIVLCGGFYLLYRLGLGQINLANQQQDFVSAVSHELKTPLTSIRMYGELLREGWASEEKKRSYYDFIFDESERLSRLINNVLQLARMTRNEQQAELQVMEVSQLLRTIESKISSQVERSGFELEVVCADAVQEASILIDPDWLTQIMINLVDNAIKFSAKASVKRVVISARHAGEHRVQFTVRDYGPGIENAQMKKIFQLFYRSESELTRETVGTGIGLSLVQQMVSNMNGKISVVNCEPGAAFRLTFAEYGN
jgi:signal transduction histidine kinase